MYEHLFLNTLCRSCGSAVKRGAAWPDEPRVTRATASKHLRPFRGGFPFNVTYPDPGNETTTTTTKYSPAERLGCFLWGVSCCSMQDNTTVHGQFSLFRIALWEFAPWLRPDDYIPPEEQEATLQQLIGLTQQLDSRPHDRGVAQLEPSLMHGQRSGPGQSGQPIIMLAS